MEYSDICEIKELLEKAFTEKNATGNEVLVFLTATFLGTCEMYGLTQETFDKTCEMMKENFRKNRLSE
jgi:hypothetical protein